MLKNNFKNQNQQGWTSARVLKVFPVVFLFLFLSTWGLIHVYFYNELWDDQGCAIGTLFCHGYLEGSTPALFDHPLHFRFSVFLFLFFLIPFVPFDFSLQRGPPTA